MIKALFIIIVACVVALVFCPEPPREPEGGTILDAFSRLLANPAAYAGGPCMMTTTGTYCFRPPQVPACFP